jgi:tRNA G18 (ribose-2'-O)-methylase SpoU
MKTLQRRIDREAAAESGFALEESFGALGLELMLCALQSPINIGLILRLAEGYQFRVSILDEHRVLDDPDKVQTVSDFSCGAMTRRSVRRISDFAAIEPLRSGRRLIATAIGVDAVPLPELRFAKGDILVLGNEYDGLPAHVVDDADIVTTIPMPDVWMPKERSGRQIDPSRVAPVSRDGEPSLNVAVSAGIVCYAAHCQWLDQRGSS